MKHTTLIGAGILMLASAMAQAAGVAFVTNIKGDAKGDSAKLTLMGELNRGQRIACIADCTIGVMFLQSGKEFVIKGPGEYLIGDTEVTVKIGLPPSVRETPWRVSSQTLVQVGQTSSASVRMRGLSSAKAEEMAPAEHLIYPVQTSVSTVQPVFRWSSSHAKGPFQFELSTANGGKPVYKAKVTAMSVKLPAIFKLLPDADYNWSVSTAGKAVGSGNFKTLPASALDLAAKRKPDSKAPFSDWLLYAVTLHELGAQADAKEILAKLAVDRPDLPELATLLK